MSQLETAKLAARRAYQKPGAAKQKNELTKEEREALVKKFSPLVYRIAKRVRWRTGFAVELDDLVCEGVIGLLQAAERFDPGMETDFEHLASVRVQGAMLDSLRRLDPLSQRRRRKARRIRDTREKLESVLGRAPTSEEMAEALGYELEEYHKLSGELSISPPISIDDVKFELQSNTSGQEQSVHKTQIAKQLATLIEELPDKQKKVLSLIYFNELSQKEVASVLRVTEARISQLHKEALGRLKKKMKNTAKPDEDAW